MRFTHPPFHVRRLTVTTVLLAAAVALLGLTSCVEFDEQELSYRYDRDSDTLLIYQEYRGVFADCATASADPSVEEVEQLHAVLHGERTFFFDNFFLGFDLPGLWRDAERPEASITDATDRLWAPVARVLAPNLKISSGPVFRDANGRLCAVQRVEIRHASEALRAFNTFLRGLCAEAARDDTTTPADVALFIRCAGVTDMVEVDASGCLVLRVPIDVESGLHAGCESNNCPIPDIAKIGAFVVEAGGASEKGPESFTIRFGQPENGAHALRHHVSTHPYTPTLARWLERHWGVADAFDPATDRRDFLAVPPSGAP